MDGNTNSRGTLSKPSRPPKKSMVVETPTSRRKTPYPRRTGTRTPVAPRGSPCTSYRSGNNRKSGPLRPLVSALDLVNTGFVNGNTGLGSKSLDKGTTLPLTTPKSPRTGISRIAKLNSGNGVAARK